jgi:SAM-dependent methyltransferase
MSDSVSFDRAASCYDATRVTDEETLRGVVDLLRREVAVDAGPVLEIGVGTGALALPLAARGARLVGVDLSGEMMSRLRDKGGGVALARADATGLPFRDAAFAGAYARWVLHLIPAWHVAVEELVRVVRPGAVVAIEPGGFAGRWSLVMDRMMAEIGPEAEPVGLAHDRDPDALDAAFTAAGAEPLGVIDVPGHFAGSLSDYFEQALARSYSWTWRVVDDDALERAVANVRRWAQSRFDDWDSPLDPEAPMRWHRYRVSGPSA